MRFRPKQTDTVNAIQLPEGASFEIISLDGPDKGINGEVNGGEWFVIHSDGSFDILTDEEFKAQFEPVQEERTSRPSSDMSEFPSYGIGVNEGLPAGHTSVNTADSGHVPLRLKKD